MAQYKTGKKEKVDKNCIFRIFAWKIIIFFVNAKPDNIFLAQIMHWKRQVWPDDEPDNDDDQTKTCFSIRKKDKFYSFLE